MRSRSILAVFLLGFAWGTAEAQSSTGNVVCESKAGEHRSCAADTSSGITLVKSTGSSSCLLGKTWGYEDTSVWVADGCSGEFSLGQSTARHFGSYTPNAGFKVASTEYGDINIKFYTYIRYLNQKQLDGTYINAFGLTSTVQQRQDIQVNKVLIYLLGWFLNPKFRYVTYVWSTNASQGLGAQVVVAGNLTYSFNPHFIFGIGINSLPGVRSTEGNWPYWLGVDERPIADEFFRPSYTTGLFAKGQIAKGLNYSIMFGNNLSQLGISAAQLDNGLNTVSAALAWFPTTGEFGEFGSFGDFENHQKFATRVAGHYTESNENRQSQPTTDNFDNVQIRLSDGTIIFTPGVFGPGVLVTDAVYHLADIDAGFKYHGFALEGEYYHRWLTDFLGPNTSGIPAIRDNGFQLQASAMIRQKLIQAYASTSMVFGKYGNPWDARLGINWFPWRNERVRANLEFIQLHRSPVGALSLPYSVGANGPTFNANFQVLF